MGIETMLIVGTVASVAGSVMGAQGSKAAGKAAMKTAEYNKSIRDRNAKVAENDAEYRVRAGDREVTKFTEKFRAMQATAETRYRKGGVVASSGTPLEVLMNSANEADEEKETIAVLAQRDAGAMRERASNERLAGELGLMEGRAKKMSYDMQAKSQMFAAVSSAAMGGYKYSQIK